MSRLNVATFRQSVLKTIENEIKNSQIRIVWAPKLSPETTAGLLFAVPSKFHETVSTIF